MKVKKRKYHLYMWDDGVRRRKKPTYEFEDSGFGGLL